MKHKKRQEVSNELYAFARQGASIHQILARFPGTSWDAAQEAIQRVAEDNKTAGPAHRANLRNTLREQTLSALSVIAGIAKDESQPTVLRLRAAEIMLKQSCQFIDESVMQSWQERPDTSLEIQPTLFDFGPVIEANGNIGFKGETKLFLVDDND